jgi:hypothetical protein
LIDEIIVVINNLIDEVFVEIDNQEETDYLLYFTEN